MFTRETIDFLSENKFQNSREWFAENRGRYTKYVFEPMAELCNRLAPMLNEIDGYIVTEPRVDRTISRIYRDMRRVRDGILYRDEMWLSFKRDKNEFPHYPEFYFVYSRHGMFYGCGYYAATADAMDAMRKMITDGDKLWLTALDAYKAQTALVIEGDKFKRSRYPDCDEEQRDWLDRKNIAFSHGESDLNLLFSDKLAETVAEQLYTAKDIYKFFIAAEERKESI